MQIIQDKQNFKISKKDRICSSAALSRTLKPEVKKSEY